MDEKGRLETLVVQTGLSDGQHTEVSGHGLQEQMQVIAGVTGGSSASASSNPFQTQPQGPGGPPRTF